MVRFARGSLGWLLAPVVLAAFLGALGHRTDAQAWYWLASAVILVFALMLLFFRDPNRPVANGLASPADGKVRAIEQVVDSDLGACTRFSIFMSPKDVHVNRTPLDGLVTSVQHRLGGHVPAFKKESESNERVEAIVDTAIGPVKIILIAGTVARRIVPYIKEGQTLVKGQRIALIRFGSRCDLYIPEGRVRWTAQVGDKVLAGASSLGELT